VVNPFKKFPSRCRALKGTAATLFLGTVGVVALPFVTPTAGASTARSSLPTAKSVITATKNAIKGESSVRLNVTSTDSKTKAVETEIADAGTSSGLQSLVQGQAKAYVRITKKAAFLGGNSKGLSVIFGVPSADIKKVGTKWISVAAGSTQYTSIVDGGTIGPLLAGLLPASTAKVTVSHESLSGQQATALSWSETASTGTVKLKLDVAATGKSLPLEINATQGVVHAVTTFAKWGEKITVATPTQTIAITKLTG